MRSAGVIVYFAWFFLAVAVRVRYTAPLRRARRGRAAASPLAYIFLLFPAAGMLLLPLAYALTDWLDFADYELNAAALVGGGLLFGLATWLLWRSHVELGRNWSPGVAAEAETKLVTDGVYARLRHPMYAAHLLWGLAQPLLLWNGLAGSATFVLTLPLVMLRLGGEEDQLLERYGDEYREYRRGSGILLPRLRVRRERRFKERLLSGSWRFILRPLLTFILAPLREAFSQVGATLRRLFNITGRSHEEPEE
ncbi:MAG: hypothetical protein GF399_12400 [Candidatus Coatesbacteria bacterium]|nr:hypothetical protein [Candidatus Coatesbacteria bacterium]